MLKFWIVGLAMLAASFAHGQWSPPPPLQTIEIPAAESSTIVTGTLIGYKSTSDNDWRSRDLTVQIKETLKGDTTGQVVQHFFAGTRNEDLDKWKAAGDLLLIATSAQRGRYDTIIDLSSPDLAVFSSDLKLLRTPEEVLAAVRREVADKGPRKAGAKFTRWLPAAAVKGTPLEKSTYEFPNHQVRVDVPMDKKVENLGISNLKSNDAGVRLQAIDILGNFPTDANVGRLRSLLRDEDWQETWHYDNNKLFVLKNAPVRSAAYKKLQSLGITVPPPVEMTPRDEKQQVVSADLGDGPVPLPSVQELGEYPNLVDLSLSGGWLNSNVIAAVGQLKPVEMLYLQSTDIRDKDLPLLAQMPNLSYLNLGGTSIDDAGLLELSYFKALKTVTVGEKATQSGIDALHKKRPDLQIHLDELAFLQQFHPSRTEMAFKGRSVHWPHGTPPDVWRYGLIFPAGTRDQVLDLTDRTLRSRGWIPQVGPTGALYGFYRVLGPFPAPSKGWHIEHIMLPSQNNPESTWGLTVPREGRLVISERITSETQVPNY